jgi:hypothetical protein
MKHFLAVCGALSLCSFGSAAFAAEEKDDRPAKALQDNSFLIEEAYNQEAGVVQHIATLRRQQRDWFFSFTQEWPIKNETHQFSYTVPYSWLRSEGQRAQGFGDLMLNYRYQLSAETATMPAIAPRVSLILPTGNSGNGVGSGSAGVQALIPVSKIVSDRVTLHANAGVTRYFDVQGLQPTSYVVGGSAIYAVTREFNLMLEALHEWNESVNDLREIERERSFIISPGFRYAFNLDAGQLVVGLAAPIKFNHERTDYGAFVYLSFEHSFVKKP